MRPLDLDLNLADPSADNLLAEFARQARREGWQPLAITKVQIEARAGDYGHLVEVIGAHCKKPHLPCTLTSSRPSSRLPIEA